MKFDSFPRMLRPALWILLGVVLASTLGSYDFTPLGRPTLDAGTVNFSVEPAGTENFQFFTFRRSTWIFDTESHSLRFVAFPDGPEQPFVSSGTFPIDRDIFPAEHLEVQLSQRTLSNYLWLVNTDTGAAMYLTALRDGGFDSSQLFTDES